MSRSEKRLEGQNSPNSKNQKTLYEKCLSKGKEGKHTPGSSFPERSIAAASRVPSYGRRERCAAVGACRGLFER